jgi:hypothetical protein
MGYYAHLTKQEAMEVFRTFYPNVTIQLNDATVGVAERLFYDAVRLAGLKQTETCNKVDPYSSDNPLNYQKFKNMRTVLNSIPPDVIKKVAGWWSPHTKGPKGKSAFELGLGRIWSKFHDEKEKNTANVAVGIRG